MSQSAQVPGGIVSSLRGRASIVAADGKEVRPLREGDVIHPGDKILAEHGTQLRITDGNGKAWAPRDVEVTPDGVTVKTAAVAGTGHKHLAAKAAAHHAHDKVVDDTISAVERGDEDAATAAGLTGGAGSMGLGLRVDRVIEAVTPQEFSYETPDRTAGAPFGVAANAAGVGSDAAPSPATDDPGKPNHDPLTERYQILTVEDEPVYGQVKATDQDGDALTFSKGSDPQHGKVEVAADGKWTYTPNHDFSGSDSFTVTVSDGKGGTATATVEVGVLPVNDPPKVIDSGVGEFDPVTGRYLVTTPEDKPVSGQVKATDVDGDPLTYAKGSDPANGTVVVHADGTWTYTPKADFNGSDSFTVTVSDGHSTATATVEIGVTPVNDAPKIVDSGVGEFDWVNGHYQVTTEEDKPVNGQVKATDVDGDPLTYAKGSDPANGTVVVHADGTWTYTPNKDFHGDDAFTVTVSDGQGGTTTTTIDLSVSPVNDEPKIIDSGVGEFDWVNGHYQVTTEEDKPVSGQVKATDVDGDPLTYAKGSDPANGTVIVHADGTWTYTPNKDFHGDDAFTVTVSDGQGGSTTTTIDLSVSPVNDEPKIIDSGVGEFDWINGHYEATTEEDKPVSGQVKATDVDGDPLTYAKGSDPTNGTVVVHADGTWTYTPNKDFHGDDAFTVTVSDGQGGSTTTTIDLSVSPVNDEPKIVDSGVGQFDWVNGHYQATTEEDKPVSGQVKATDVDGDPLTYAKGSDPANGTVVVHADGTWTYTPNKDFNGDDAFTVTVSDGQGGTTITTIEVGVSPVNDAPKVVDSGAAEFDPVTGQYLITTGADKPADGQANAADAGSNASPSDIASGDTGMAPIDQTPADQIPVNQAPVSQAPLNEAAVNEAPVNGAPLNEAPINAAPVIRLDPSAPFAVSEEGLHGGQADTHGSSDTGNSREAAGQLTVSDADGDPVSLTLSGPTGLTAGGLPITWSGTGTEADPLLGQAGGTVILSATIDGQGHYKVTLQAAIDHDDTTTEDVRNIALQVHANDGQQTSTQTLNVLVEDDSPLSGTQVMQVASSTGTQDTNLMLIIDTSGSMKAALADQTVNGIKAAIKSLVDRYDDIGEVKVQIVTFDDAGQGRPAWLTVAQAKTFIDTLTANGGTNYDSALAAAKASFATSGKLDGAVNVSYFITDGQPTSGKGIDTGADKTNWESFLKANHIDAYAMGIGGLTAQHIANIEPIAYNGITSTEQPAVTLKSNTELSKYLLDTVPTLKAGSLAGLAGGDGLKLIESFSSSKQVSSSLDPGTKVQTITLQSGTEIKLNTVTGEFTMKQGHDGGDETFSYTMVDKDGDRATGAITLSSAATAAANHAPEVTATNAGSNILGLVDLAVDPLLDLSKEQHVAAQDVDNNLVRVDVSVGQFLSLGTLLGDHSKLSLALDANLIHGLQISGNDSRHLVIESDTPGHTIDVTQVNQLLATLAYDPAHVLGLSVDLFPKLTIQATDAAGASATKSLSSSLIAIDMDLGGAASTASSLAQQVEHALSGHGDHQASNASDVFAWTLADRPAQGDTTQHADTIHGFDCAARSAGGDVLDLRDLLHTDQASGGASTGTSTGSVDKLLNFLDFDTQSQPGSTIIHISAEGGFHADASGQSDSAGCAGQQHIVLANVDIRSSLGLDQQANDHQIISELMNRGKLLVDHNGC